MSSAHSPSFQSLHLRHRSVWFSKLCHFTYVTVHSPTLPSLYLRHNSFSNPSVASPTWQLILHPFFRLSYVTGFSLTSPGEPPMLHTFDISGSNNARCYVANTVAPFAKKMGLGIIMFFTRLASWESASKIIARRRDISPLYPLPPLYLSHSFSRHWGINLKQRSN